MSENNTYHLCHVCQLKGMINCAEDDVCNHVREYPTVKNIKIMKLKIKVTKEILEATKNCGVDGFKLPNAKNGAPAYNCAITLACQEIFPNCSTAPVAIWLGVGLFDEILLPTIAREFIYKFDNLKPEERVLLEPIEFEVDLPESIIDNININDLKNSKTLEIIK